MKIKKHIAVVEEPTPTLTQKMKRSAINIIYILFLGLAVFQLLYSISGTLNLF